MTLPFIDMFMGPNYRCDCCGALGRETEQQFGRIVMNVRTMGVCCECYILVCGACCSPGSRCPKCGLWLLNPQFPPSRPSWLHPIKRMKYMRVFG